jgi:hypothetical protein
MDLIPGPQDQSAKHASVERVGITIKQLLPELKRISDLTGYCRYIRNVVTVIPKGRGSEDMDG